MSKVIIMTGGSGGTGSDECTARKADVLKGKKAVTSDSGDEAAEGTLEVQSIVNFKVAQYSNLTLIGTWALPPRGPWSGVRIMCKQGDYPTNASDGTLFYEGAENSATKSLVAGTWYFRAWNYMTTNYGRVYGGYAGYSVSNEEVHGQSNFTSSGVFTVPDGVYSIQFFAVGSGSSNSGPGGGGGYTATSAWISVVPGSQFAIGIGSGNYTESYVNDASAARILTANSGFYSAGGSGGGAGGSSQYPYAGDGGADGSKGNHNRNRNGVAGSVGGNGQGSTTRAFGESSGTLYAAGGGGASGTSNWDGRGNGGAGGGGIGGCIHEGAGNGGYGTGGGGGGGRYKEGGAGGSGAVLVRW